MTDPPEVTDEPEETDNFVSSNFRAARLESENNALKSRLAEIVARCQSYKTFFLRR